MVDSLEALENISITFDEGGYEPTTLGAKEGHFYDVFKYEYKIIEKDLKRLKKLEKALEIIKLCNVDTDRLFFFENAEQYNQKLYYEFYLDEEEFKLLREVLGDDK